MSEWKRWSEHPPQIPWAPVRVSLCAGDIEFVTLASSLRNSVWCRHAVWTPTGIYRQEYFEVMGQWL